ncbi:Copper homeostasis protein CutC [Tritrichomonas foetus]|uniref:Copper homeostasis protein cutC homolog n=1 Tax=Tritrichomonas foetus TaxID=1144522 RepID=A0A1J4JU05_9EUKA|nr:Copper homeostasis protein CutC [Tritrichomonas foetus]|eukprot:OHT02515.1 Copper homeostasis protein CutC [Tritrichomonas foetus]
MYYLLFQYIIRFHECFSERWLHFLYRINGLHHSRQMSKKYTIEICTYSAESVKEAMRGGADRCELCSAMPEGGCTPSAGEIWKARQVPNIKLMVMIRPRGGDFLYSPDEIEIMEHDIEIAKSLGADGVVFGCLTADGDIDVAAMKKLMSHCEGLDVTCHRAFDMCRDPVKGLEDIISVGVNRVLTSGQKVRAFDGIPLLKKLVEQSKGRIIIMPGCGVNKTNIAEIVRETGATEIHFSAKTQIPSLMKYKNEDISMSGTAREIIIDEYSREVTSPELVRLTRAKLTE